MQKNIIMHFPLNTEQNSSLEPNSFWRQIMKYFLQKADSIEIHCWNEETTTIEEIKSQFYLDTDIIQEDKLTIFHGKNTAAFTQYISNKAGALKWFTVNLMNGKTMVLHSSHWGTEIFVPNVTEQEISFIKSVSPKDALIESYLLE